MRSTYYGPTSVGLRETHRATMLRAYKPVAASTNAGLTYIHAVSELYILTPVSLSSRL